MNWSKYLLYFLSLSTVEDTVEELRLVEATGVVEAMEVLLQGTEEDIRVVSLRELLKDLLLVQTHSKCNY